MTLKCKFLQNNYIYYGLQKLTFFKLGFTDKRQKNLPFFDPLNFGSIFGFLHPNNK